MGPVPGAGAAKHLGWGSNLSRLPQRQNGKPPLPESIFGREMRGQMGKGHGDKVVVEEEFIPCYSYDELGKRLSELRPAPAPAAGKDMKEWFSVEELSQRLKRLREMDKEERGRALQSGMGTGLLRKAIVSLKDQEKTNNLSAAQIMPVLVGFGSREATPAYMLRKPQNELVERYFHPDHMSSAEKMKLELQRVRDEFKMSENDCGSARVQVAQLTTKIKHLSVTLHKKDKHSRKGLQEMVQRRKKYLKYLRRTDWDSYCLVLSKLGLRDVPEYKPPDYKNKSSSSSSKTKAKRKSKRKMKA
uniref:Small ribosomal subunit protein uS15c n=1 Tax=Leersia perrieri TaxID=77586 RepID=A0A0D9WMH0_9ORYZ